MDIFDKANNWTAADDVRKAGLYPYFKAITSALGTEVVIGGQKMIMVGSNNYMGLVGHPEVKKAMNAATDKYGTGCSGSRFLNGTIDLHDELEAKLAKFVGMEATLMYSTGYQSNLGVLSTIVTRGEYILSDRENHASIIDGTRLAFAKTVKYEHNDMADLERVLANHKDSPVLIVSDGIFSMGGDLVDLPKMVALKKKYGGRIMIDEAHSLGVIGKTGAGTGEHFGLQKDVDIVMGTFSKSFASLGGFIGSTHKVIDYLKHNSRPLMFSASMPPGAVAAVLKSLEIMQREPERRERLWAIVNKMKKAYNEMGYKTLNTGSAIIPLFVGDDSKIFMMAKRLGELGVFATPIPPPAVEPGMSLIRTSYSATHTDDQLDYVLDQFRTVGKEFGVIP